jgi:hypothetical protein
VAIARRRASWRSQCSNVGSTPALATMPGAPAGSSRSQHRAFLGAHQRRSSSQEATQAMQIVATTGAVTAKASATHSADTGHLDRERLTAPSDSWDTLNRTRSPRPAADSRGSSGRRSPHWRTSRAMCLRSHRSTLSHRGLRRGRNHVLSRHDRPPRHRPHSWRYSRGEDRPQWLQMDTVPGRR